LHGIDAENAVAIALEEGGTGYIERHPDATRWFVQLGYNRISEQNIVAWRVYFGVGGESAFEVFIDPLNGEVLDQRERP